MGRCLWLSGSLWLTLLYVFPSDRDHHSSSSSRHPHSSSSSSHRPSSSSASRSSRPASGIVDVAKASKAFIPEAGSSSGAQKKPKSEFLCEIPFTNTLPEVPFEPKLLKIYLPLERLTRYCAGSLEASLKLPFLTDKMLGIPLDLLNPSQYNRPEYVTKGELDTADEAILPVVKDTLAAGERAQPTQLQLFQQGSSNWLRKQELQSNNLYDMAIRTTGSAEQIQKEYMRVEEAKKQLAIANTKEKQVALIETTFESGRETERENTNERKMRVVGGEKEFVLMLLVCISLFFFCRYVFQSSSACSGPSGSFEASLTCGRNIRYLSGPIFIG